MKRRPGIQKGGKGSIQKGGGSRGGWRPGNQVEKALQENTVNPCQRLLVSKSKIRTEKETSTGFNGESPVHLSEKSFCKIG